MAQGGRLRTLQKLQKGCALRSQPFGERQFHRAARRRDRGGRGIEPSETLRVGSEKAVEQAHVGPGGQDRLGTLRHPDRRRLACRHLSGESQRFLLEIFRDKLVDKTRFEGLCRGYRFPAGQQFERAAHRDQPWQALRAAGARNQAQPDFRETQSARRKRQPEMTA